MLRMARFGMCCVAWLLLATRLLAWSDGGHRVVALIAAAQLNPETLHQVVEILRHHPRFEEDFVTPMPELVRGGSYEEQARWLLSQAAVWPDMARTFPGKDRKYHHGSWHYVNLPLYLTDRDRKQLELKHTIDKKKHVPEHHKGRTHLAVGHTQLPTEDWFINHAFHANRDVFFAPETPPAERAVALCWLIHLAGDSHQPLHATGLFTERRFVEGDRGGNEISVTKSESLHERWDGLLGHKVRWNDCQSRAAFLRHTPGAKTIGQKAAQDTEIEHWLEESFELAQKYAYTAEVRAVIAEGEATPTAPLDIVVLPKSYWHQAGEIADHQVLVAGYRLAAVLQGSHP